LRVSQTSNPHPGYLIEGVFRSLFRVKQMGRADKILVEMETNPRGWRYEEVASLLRAFGFQERRGATSHRQWTHSGVAPVTIIAGGGRVPEYQVRQATQAIRTSMEEA
jgi:predicted RNA binding protein YcfA (HicA-like mRNA interferase family)